MRHPEDRGSLFPAARSVPSGVSPSCQHYRGKSPDAQPRAGASSAARSASHSFARCRWSASLTSLRQWNGLAAITLLLPAFHWLTTTRKIQIPRRNFPPMRWDIGCGGRFLKPSSPPVPGARSRTSNRLSRRQPVALRFRKSSSCRCQRSNGNARSRLVPLITSAHELQHPDAIQFKPENAVSTTQRATGDLRLRSGPRSFHFQRANRQNAVHLSNARRSRQQMIPNGVVHRQFPHSVRCNDSPDHLRHRRRQSVKSP